MQLHLSDLHLGVEKRDETKQTMVKIAQFLGENRGIEHVILSGDGIAGTLQRQMPDWLRIKDEAFEPLGEYLETQGRDIQFTYVHGNCEDPHNPESYALHGNKSDGYIEHSDGVLTFHGHQLEPSRNMLIADAVLHTVESISRKGRKALERMLPQELFDRTAAMELMELCMKNDPAASRMLEAQDMNVHQATTALNASIDRLLQRMPWIRNSKDRFVLRVLEDVYLRSIVTLTSDLIEQGKMAPAHTISFGHIHEPNCMFTSQELLEKGISAKHMPSYVVNTGTGVPLLQQNGGTNQAHFVTIDAAGTPSLWRSFDPANPKRPPFKIR